MRDLVASACTLVATLIFAGCGIPSTSYIPPIPEDSIVRPLEGETFFSFGIPVDNNPEIFEGFEIYYKFYRIDDENLIAKIGDETLATPVTQQSLRNARYRRLSNPVDPAELESVFPLVPIERIDRSDADLLITLDFGIISTSYPYSTYGDIYLSRLIEVPGVDPIYKGFSTSDFDTTDPDLPIGGNLTGITSLYLSLYAMSYGNSISDLRLDIHSVAVYLGRILIVFDQLL